MVLNISFQLKLEGNPNLNWDTVAFYCTVEDPTGVTWLGCFELISWEWHRRGSCDEAHTIKIPQFSARAWQIIICEKAGAIVTSQATQSCTLCWIRSPQQHTDCKNPTDAVSLSASDMPAETEWSDRLLLTLPRPGNSEQKKNSSVFLATSKIHRDLWIQSPVA